VLAASFGLDDALNHGDVTPVFQASKDAVLTGASGTWPAYLTGFRREGGEAPCPVGFSTRGARSAYLRYVEHPEARKNSWVRCIAGRSRKLVRYAG